MTNIHIVELNDSKIWDDFIRHNGQWSLFQSFAWGDVCQSRNQTVIRLGLYHDELLMGVAQVLVIKARRGTFLHLRQGPVIIAPDTHTEYSFWQNLFSYLKSLAKQEKAAFIRVSPMIENTPEYAKMLTSLGLRLAPIHAMDGEICWVLDLGESEEVILANMRKSTRYLIRQAEKSNVVVEQTNNIDAFLDLYTKTASRQGFVSHQGIREEYEVFSKTNDAVLLLASQNGELLAGALVLFFGTQAIYHHGASVPTKTGAAHLLQWRAIQEAKKRGMARYNFWGIAPLESTRHPWKGLTLFKQGFGGREMRFMHAHDLPISPWYLVSYTIEIVRKLRRGY